MLQVRADFVIERAPSDDFVADGLRLAQECRKTVALGDGWFIRAF